MYGIPKGREKSKQIIGDVHNFILKGIETLDIYSI